MAEIRITADMQEAVRAQQQLADAATKGAKSAADAVAKVGDAWTTAGAKSSRVLKEQEAMVARMVMRVDQAASASRRADFEQRKMDPFHQGAQATDARTTAANLDLAKRRHQGDISAALGEATIDAAKNERMPDGSSGTSGPTGVIGKLTEKFGGLITAAAGVSLAFAAIKFFGDAQNADRNKAGELAADMMERKKQLGRDAAILGLNGDQVKSAQNAGTYTTVQENENAIHQMAAQVSAKPYGMPRPQGAEVMDLLEKYKATGNGNLVNVLGMPQAVPGNIGPLGDMTLRNDSGNPQGGGSAIDQYNTRVPHELAAAAATSAGLSQVNDKNEKKRYNEGKNVIFQHAGRELRRNSGVVGNIISKYHDLTDWIPHSSDAAFDPIDMDERYGRTAYLEGRVQESAARAHLKELKKQTGILNTVMTKPPKPGRRDGDQ